MSRQFQYMDWAEPVQPEGDPNPAKWSPVYPDKIDRKQFLVADQQSFTGPLVVVPLLSVGWYPDQINRKSYPTCNQQSFFGPIDVVPLISMWLPDYPDMIQRKKFTPANLNPVVPGGITPVPPSGVGPEMIWAGTGPGCGGHRFMVRIGR